MNDDDAANVEMSAEQVEQLVRELSEPFDKWAGNVGGLAQAIAQLTPEVRLRLARQMRITAALATVLAQDLDLFESGLLGNGGCDEETMSLLGAINPNRLSSRALEMLATDCARLVASWDKLPRRLLNAIHDHQNDSEEVEIEDMQSSGIKTRMH